MIDGDETYEKYDRKVILGDKYVDDIEEKKDIKKPLQKKTPTESSQLPTTTTTQSSRTPTLNNNIPDINDKN